MRLVYFQKTHLKVGTIKSIFPLGKKMTKDKKKNKNNKGLQRREQPEKLYGKGWMRDAVVTTGDKKCCGSESPSQQMYVRAFFVH